MRFISYYGDILCQDGSFTRQALRSGNADLANDPATCSMQRGDDSSVSGWGYPETGPLTKLEKEVQELAGITAREVGRHIGALELNAAHLLFGVWWRSQ